MNKLKIKAELFVTYKGNRGQDPHTRFIRYEKKMCGIFTSAFIFIFEMKI